MFLNIITPCSRPWNLKYIYESINIPKENYRWIIVHDSFEVPNIQIEGLEMYAHENENSISGNAQRNFGLNLIEKGHIYFNDDDTIVHPQLWKKINKLTNDFILFNQYNKNETPRLTKGLVRLNEIDSHNFIIESSLSKNIKWILNRRDADGVYAEQCFKNSKSFIYINETLSIYNSLQ
jgi:hypothetical protein